jgi:hypothetical protein
MELTSDINIVPGLSGLNLNILHAIDMHMIDNALNCDILFPNLPMRLDLSGILSQFVQVLF